MEDIIYAYTRAMAIADGVLIDVSEIARECGFRFPVAVTEAVWNKCVSVPDGVSGQDERGRLWDVLWMLHVAIHKSTGAGDTLNFKVLVRQTDEGKPKPVTLKSVCGPGDNAEPVLTVMLPSED